MSEASKFLRRESEIERLEKYFGMETPTRKKRKGFGSRMMQRAKQYMSRRRMGKKKDYMPKTAPGDRKFAEEWVKKAK